MDIMKAILDIEAKAQGIVDRIDDIQKNIDDEIKEEVSAIRMDFCKEAEKKIVECTAETEEKKRAEMLKLEEEAEKKRIELENRFLMLRDEWVGSITNAIVGLDDI